MEKIPLGKTGVSVSQFSLGCMLMGSLTDIPTSYKMLDCYSELGGNFLDTANCYAWWIGKGEFIGDESEQLLGNWMKERKNRNEIFLATKFGARLKNPQNIRDKNGVPIWDQVPNDYEYLSPKVVRHAIENSLRRLQTDYIDLYYAHVDDRMTPIEDTLGELNKLVQEGKIRYIGCSNLKTWRLAQARLISESKGWASYIAVQQQYSYFRPKPGADFGIAVNVNEELLDYLRSNEDITLVAYSPLLKGIYDDQQKREAYYNWPLFNHDDSQIRLKTLSNIARELNISNSQLVLAWLLHHQPRVIPILGASNINQFTHNLGSLNVKLSKDILTVLNNASV